MISENSENSDNTFYCKKCEYKCSLKQHFVQHCKTIKHNDKKKISDYHNGDNNNLDDNTVYICVCGKEYLYASGLSRHKKICTYKVEEEQELKNLDKDELVLALIKDGISSVLNNHLMTTTETNKQNQEFQLQMFTQLIEVIKNSNNIITTNSHNTNNNYNQFNLNVYLNETCKNAMNIDQFIDYLQPTLQELEDTARLGYVEGITRIILRGLKDLEENERPFHCSDLKRETMFVKNNNDIWEKETDEKPQLLKVIKAISRKNFCNVNAWQKAHPTWRNHDSKKNDQYNKMMVNSTSGSTVEEQKHSYEKIIKNIAKETVINKNKNKS